MPPPPQQQQRRLLSVAGGGPSHGSSANDLLAKQPSMISNISSGKEHHHQPSSSSPSKNSDEKRLIAADHDDEADDQIMNRNPRDWPFPSFEPAGDDAARRSKNKLKQAKETMKEVQRAPAVIAIQAPHETDRPPWKAAITFKHNDAPPLDLRAEKKTNLLSSGIDASSSPNAFLLEQSRPRWVSIAQTRLVSGCPSRGIPLHEFENPSAVSARRWEKPSGSVSGSSARGPSSSRSRGTSVASVNNNRNNNSRKVTASSAVEDPTSSRSLKKLLNQMDSQAAGTRSHQPREQKVLSFLRESSKAQQSIRQRVLHPDEHDEDDFHGEEGKLVLAASFSGQHQQGGVGGAPFLVSKKRKQEYVESAREKDRQRQRQVEIQIERENELKSFEDYVQPKQESLAVSLRAATTTSTANPAEASLSSRSVKLPQLLGASTKSTATTAMMNKSTIASNNNSTDGDGTPQKILVRLPKVGLSLFSVQK